MFARTGTRIVIFVFVVTCCPMQAIAQPLFHTKKDVEFELLGHDFGGREVHLNGHFSYTMFYVDANVIQCPLPMIWTGVVAFTLLFVAAGLGNWVYGRTRQRSG